MFPRFVFCLVPALLACIVAVLAASNSLHGILSTDAAFGIIFVLIGGGAIYCGVTVARRVFRSIKDEGPSRMILSILTFIGVAIGYVTLCGAGCCGVVLAGSAIASY